MLSLHPFIYNSFSICSYHNWTSKICIIFHICICYWKPKSKPFLFFVYVTHYSYEEEMDPLAGFLDQSSSHLIAQLCKHCSEFIRPRVLQSSVSAVSAPSTLWEDFSARKNAISTPAYGSLGYLLCYFLTALCYASTFVNQIGKST